MAEKLLLIDGYSILKQAFYGLPTEGKEAGTSVNAVYGFVNLFFQVMQEYAPEYLMAVLEEDDRVPFDGLTDDTFQELPEEFKGQLPVLKKVLDAMQVSTVSVKEKSAADVLNTIVETAAQENGTDEDTDHAGVLILTGDRRFLQAVSEKTAVLIPVMTAGKSQLQCYHAADVEAEFMIVPKQWPQLRALAGDPEHGISGIPGMGERAAARLLKTYGSVSSACAHADELKNRVPEKNVPENEAALQKIIAAETLQTDASVKTEDGTVWKTPQFLTPEAYTILEQLGMKDLLKRFDADHAPQKKAAEVHEVTALAEAEALFAEIMKYAEGRPDRFVGYALIEDSENPEDFIGLSLAFEEGKSYLIRPEGLITTGYLG
ncbi:MAG: hypothetical protein LKF52_05475, partial [Butyrivibrio sp.]|nr:hypothetical protein [Butyrivibrio sp.]